VTEQLTSLGYWFAIARSGTEALEKARRLQPGAIFLNPLLPLLSGWDVLTLLKSDAATSEIPVIVTTTRAEKDYAFSNRADEFLSLPVQQQVLQKVLTRFCEQPSLSDSRREVSQRVDRAQSLTILRLVTPHPSPLPPSLLLNHRVLEADDLAPAALLARVWQPDVVLLDGVIPEPLAYLKQFSQYASLAALPIVTLDALTTQAASQIAGLSVFPCLTPTPELAIDELLAVLQNAAGISWEHSILLVDVATLPDLQEVKAEELEKHSSLLTPHSSLSLRSEWFQALIQYLYTAGFKGAIARSWEEVLQQIRQQSVDLLLICLGESQLTPAVLTALKELGQQQNLPPVLVLDQQLSEAEAREQFPHCLGKRESTPTPSVAIAVSDTTQLLELVLGAIAAEILPHNLSMEELLERINRTLARPSRL
jgi:CheY-like chemotaxis protein